MSSLAPKNYFIGLEGCVHLAAGGETPQLRTIKEALERFVEDKSRGGDSRARFLDVSQEARERLGRMMKVPASDIAFLGSCSDAINQVCWSLPWQEGDNVVINDLDYPTMIYPFARLESRYGVEVRVVRSRDFDLSTRDFAEAIDRRTRLVPVSHVSYLTGLRHDLYALAKIAHRNGAAILTDVSPLSGASFRSIRLTSTSQFAAPISGSWAFTAWASSIGTDGCSQTSTLCSSGRPLLRSIRPFLIRPESPPGTTPAGSRLGISPGSVYTPLSTDSATLMYWAANRCTIMFSAWPP